jgi:hypothetical protein
MATPPPNNPQADALKEIQSLLDQINKSYKSLGKDSPFPKDVDKVLKGFNNVDDAVEALKDSLEAVNDRIKASNDSANDLLSTLKNIIKEINPRAVSYTKDFESGFKKVVKEAQKLQYAEEGINKLSKKELEQIKERVRQGQSDIKSAAERLLTENGITKDIDRRTSLYKGLNPDIQAAVNFLKDESSILAIINDKIERQINLEKESNKVLGISGGLLDGLDTALGKLGFSKLATLLGIDEAKQKMNDLSDKIVKDRQKEIDIENEIISLKRKRPRTEEGKKDQADRLKALQEEKDLISAQNREYDGMKGKMAVLITGIKSMGKSLIEALKDPATIITFSVNAMIDALNKADKETGELAKAFGTSYSEAASLRNELNTIANLSGDVNITTSALQKSLIAVNKEFGTATMFSGELLKDFTQLTEVAGYTNEAASRLSKISVATGTDLSKNTAQILGTAKAFNVTNKLALNEKEIVEEVAKASKATTLSLGMQPGKLAQAVAQAKALGSSLEKVEAISQSLLNFESSISSELEAELLTGKDLNLERARMYALNNDIEGVAREIAGQIGSAANFTKMNVIQQEALAKSVGMTREDLASSLIERQALAAIGEGDKTAAEAYNRLKKEGLSDAQIAVRLGDKELANQLRSQSVQERFNASVEKLKEIFVSLAEPILQIVSPFMDLATTILPLINIALTPFTASIQFIGEGISYIVNSVKALFGYLTGSNEQLTIMQGIIGTIAGLYGIIKGRALAIQIIEGVKLGIKGKQSLLDQKALFTANKSLTKTIGMAVFNAISSFSKIPFGVGVGLGLVAAAGIAAIASKYADDMISPGDNKTGYGKRTLFGPEGAIQLNNNDTVIAGTDLEGKKSKSSSLKPSSPASLAIDYNKMAAAVATSIAKEINNRPVQVSVEMDGEKVAKGVGNNSTKFSNSMSTNTFQVQ